jgi:hypothetical protein
MQRLFRVYDSKTRKFETENFENKMDAKKLRDELNEKGKTTARFTVSRGEDHLMGTSRNK